MVKGPNPSEESKREALMRRRGKEGDRSGPAGV